MARDGNLRFLFRLAKELGEWDVPTMANAMPALTLRAWQAYAEAEPFGEERADLRIAQLTALLANVHRDPKRTTAFKSQDFMFDFVRARTRRKRTPAQIWSALKGRVMMLKEAATGRRKAAPKGK